MLGARLGLVLFVLAAALSFGCGASAVEPKPVTRTQMVANRRVVLDFWRVVIEARDLAHIADYVAPGMVQHNPTMTNGIDGFAAFARTRWQGETPRPVEPVLRNPPAMVLVDGDLVQLVFCRATPEPAARGMTYDRYTFDLYRVAGGKIVEHWDNVTKPTSEPGAH